MKRLLPGLDVQLGRQAYTSGAEAASGDATIEAVKRQRLDARLIGEFEWSLYQRSFDGLRRDWSKQGTRATGLAVMPTQGGFAREAGKALTDVWVYGGALSLAPGTPARRTELQGFVWRYDDSRPVTGRPDNTGRIANAADIGITTLAARPSARIRSARAAWMCLAGWPYRMGSGTSRSTGHTPSQRGAPGHEPARRTRLDEGSGRQVDEGLKGAGA